MNYCKISMKCTAKKHLQKTSNDELYNKSDDIHYDYNGIASIEALNSVDKVEETLTAQLTDKYGKRPTSISTDPNFPFTCDICGFRLKSLKTVAYHMQKVHIEKMANISTAKSEQNPYECDICKNAYSTPKAIYRHKYRVHGLRKVKVKKEPRKRQKRLQICPICGLARREIRSHIATHSEARNFKCEICGMGIKNAENLKRHIRRVHSEIRCVYVGKRERISFYLKIISFSLSGPIHAQSVTYHLRLRRTLSGITESTHRSGIINANTVIVRSSMLELEIDTASFTFKSGGKLKMSTRSRGKFNILTAIDLFIFSIECEFCGKLFMTPVSPTSFIYLLREI